MKRYRLVKDERFARIWDLEKRWLGVWWKVTFVTADSAADAVRKADEHLQPASRTIVEFSR